MYEKKHRSPYQCRYDWHTIKKHVHFAMTVQEACEKFDIPDKTMRDAEKRHGFECLRPCTFCGEHVPRRNISTGGHYAHPECREEARRNRPKKKTGRPPGDNLDMLEARWHTQKQWLMSAFGGMEVED